MADKSTTIISLPQMVDLALNSPEVGIVNFTVLHSLLHVIVNQLNLDDCNVEFRGSDSERLQNYISTAKPGPIITLTEYTIGPDGKERKKKKRRGKKGSIVDEKGKKDEAQKEKEIAILKKEDEAGSLHEASSGSLQTIVVVEPASREKIGDTPKFTVALTKEQLGKIQKDIKELQQQVNELTELPGNMGLIDAIRGSGSSNSPILDMFQILTLVKRLDATEVAMNKIASMLEDLAKGQAEAGGAKEDTKLSFKDQTGELVEKTKELRKSLDSMASGNKHYQELVDDVTHLKERVTQLENRPVTSSRRSSKKSEASDLEQPIGKKPKDKRDSVDTEGGDDEDIDFDNIDLSTLSPKEAIAILQSEILDIKENNLANDAAVQALKEVEQLKESLLSGADSTKLPPDAKLGQMDIKINDLKEQVTTLDTVYHQQFSKIHERADNLEQEIAALWERINSGLPAGDASSAGNNQGIQELYNKLLQLQEDMNSLAETANKLLSEREGRQNSLDIMIEQIELLKAVKADREDLEDALADKADTCQINRKVSHEQFDAAYDEITKSLEIALDKLRTQEELWLQSLNELQKEIGNKLDKMELTPLKDFINSKLKGIHDKVKKISALKHEHEAAGTKSKLLRNVNCISCDADVVMRKQTDITMLPKPYAMPANKSPAPYLAYELDLLRQQKKGLASGKNLNLFENALQAGKAKASDKDHLCTRYCGGSHTVTTPHQRVMRVGHFMEQWGPEIAPVNEVLVKGTDGHLYKGRDDAALKAAANEKTPPTPRPETPAFTINECNTSGIIKDSKNEVRIASAPKISMSGTNKIEPQGSEASMSGRRPKTSGQDIGKQPDQNPPSVQSGDKIQN